MIGVRNVSTMMAMISVDTIKGHAVQWAHDSSDPPRLNEHMAIVTVGKDWLREHLPSVWASFCAARLGGRDELQMDHQEWERVCNETLTQETFAASNERIATEMIKAMHRSIDGRATRHTSERIQEQLEPDAEDAIYLGTWRPEKQTSS